jgi:hypothetical protein
MHQSFLKNELAESYVSFRIDEDGYVFINEFDDSVYFLWSLAK